MRRAVASFLKKHKYALCVWLGIVVIYAFFYLVGIGCPIKFITGISCAGCGMTRACISALTLDFSTAFYYHPLWILLPFALFFLVFFKAKNKKRAFDLTLVLCVTALVGIYAYRLLFTDSDVVTFDPQSSAVWRLANQIFKK